MYSHEPPLDASQLAITSTSTWLDPLPGSAMNVVVP